MFPDRSFSLVIGCFMMLASCAPEAPVEKKEEKAPVAERKITDKTFFENDITGYSDAQGAIGVFDVPEMLVLSIIDSSSARNMASGMVKNYSILEEEMVAIGAEMNGPIGMISYNNDTRNFTYETVLCIKRIPAIQPKRCKIVVLEASKMLIYNFYGPYESLFAAYDKIKRHCEKEDLIQSGPIREFYITDPEKEKNPEKWLTRIMLPVVSMHEK